MITLTTIFKSDMYRLSKNKVLIMTLFLPQLMIIAYCAFHLDSTVQYNKSGYDLWIIFSKDILMVLTFIFPLLAILYPFVIYDNEHRFFGIRTHTVLPLKMGNYFLSKLLITWFFLAFIVFSCSIIILIIGYALGWLLDIPEFFLYKPTFIFYYSIGLLINCIFLSSLHVVLNTFIKNFLINTAPFLLLLFMSFFITEWSYNMLIPHAYPFITYSNLLFDYGIFLQFPFVISFCGTVLIAFLIKYVVPRFQYMWIR